MDGKFIVLEGISGSGKGTQAGRIIQHLQSLDEYANILITPEPTASKYGQEVRDLMKSHRNQGKNPEEHARTYFDLFLQDRLQHQELITYNLQHGVHVIGVRYYHSTIVHQQCTALPAEEIVRKHGEAGVRVPDLTVILDVMPSRALGRITNRDERGVYETTNRMQKSRERYLQLPDLLTDQNIIIVNGLGSIDEVFQQYKSRWNQIMGYEDKKK